MEIEKEREKEGRKKEEGDKREKSVLGPKRTGMNTARNRKPFSLCLPIFVTFRKLKIIDPESISAR